MPAAVVLPPVVLADVVLPPVVPANVVPADVVPPLLVVGSPVVLPGAMPRDHRSYSSGVSSRVNSKTWGHPLSP